MNLTIVSVPFPFNDNAITVLHQHNAIRSWLQQEVPVALIGDEHGIKETASQYNVQHIGEIARNELGDLSMRSIFKRINENVSTDWIAYLDTDAILLDDFLRMFEQCSQRWDNCLMCAGRWDAKIDYEINFENPYWQRNAKNKIFKLHMKGSDYFVYRRGQFQHIPDFSIGRGWWDGWMIGAALKKKIPVIDVTDICKVIHQWHGHRWSGKPGTGRNKRLCNVEAWIMDATHKLKDK